MAFLHEKRAIEFVYTSWRGETSTRRATPLRVLWGSSEWHPEPQWILRAFDHDREEVRDFALRDCIFDHRAQLPG